VLGLAYTLKDYRKYNFFVKTRNELIAKCLSNGDALTVESNYSGTNIGWTAGYELIGRYYMIAIY